MNHRNSDDNIETSEILHSRLQLLPAALSMILPGLGQLVQRRIACVVHMGLFALSLFIIFLVCGGEIESWSMNGFTYVKLNLLLVFFCSLFAIFPFLTILFSVLDAAIWEKERPSSLQGPITHLAVATIICIVALLIILPMISAAREAARRMQCSNNLKVISAAMSYYHDEYRCFPPAFTVDAAGQPLHSWRVLLLPYLEQKTLYEKIRLDEPWNSEYNKQFHQEKLDIFQCPSMNLNGVGNRLLPKMKIPNSCSYSVVVGNETSFPGSQTTHLGNITDGASNSLLIVERLLPVCWTDPNHEITFDSASKGVNRDCFGIGSAHYNGANAAFADGSVRFIADTIESVDMKALLKKSGSEKTESR